MDAVTYPDPQVVQYLNQNFVCLKLQIDVRKDVARRFAVKWTPGLVWLDAQGNARHQNVGYFEPTEFLAESAYGRGQVAVGSSDWAKAIGCFAEVLERWPKSFTAPAALYWAGVAGKMATGKPEPLLEHWKRLPQEYPDSAWAMKVSFLGKK